jgi:uncharacterized protein (TIGR03905 family)
MSVKYEFPMVGVCAKKVVLEMEDSIVQGAIFEGGCAGNLLGIGSLLKGMPVKEVIKRFEGINCGQKTTSCPDQLAQILKKKFEKE